MKNDFNLKGDSIIYMNDQALQYLHMKPNSTHMSERFDSFVLTYFAKSARYGGVINDFHVRDICNNTNGIILLTCRNIKQPLNISILVEGDPMEAYARIKEIYTVAN